jgi:hypothetical protein
MFYGYSFNPLSLRERVGERGLNWITALFYIPSS